MNVLLVEASYKNKYPPMGLMKISQYHKMRGDYVYFFKGKYNSSRIWDRIYITSLFTFDFDLVSDTIDFYKNKVMSPDDIYVGGIAATIMEEKFRERTQLKNIITNQLTDSSMIGFSDHINIDQLPLDYDLLNDTDYVYPAGDNYFGYTSRGCVNKCPFCAVPLLEGPLKVTNGISDQIKSIRENYGDKRNLLLLDNNILGVPNDQLREIVDDIKDLGFVNKPTYNKLPPLKTHIETYHRYVKRGQSAVRIVARTKDYLYDLLEKKGMQRYKEDLLSIMQSIGNDFAYYMDGVIHYEKELLKLSRHAHSYKPLQRYVDFNQGLDARELTEEKMAVLAELPLKPFRVAFDHIKFTPIYEKAIRLAAKYGIKHFSNYILYNYEDTPEDFYQRMEVNVHLAKELGVHMYSFPMKFAPIDQTYRDFVGENWNRHYLRTVQAILNVTKGVAPKEASFFYKAFGNNTDELKQILTMPHDYVVYRKIYEDNGYTDKWIRDFNKLNQENKKELLALLSDLTYTSENPRLQNILQHYTNRYDKKTKNCRLAVNQ